MHPIPTQGLLLLGELVNKIATSASKLKKRLRTARKKIQAITQEHRRIAKAKGLYAVCVTLTYADNSAFGAKHVTRFLNCLRSKLKRLGYPLLYIWTLERAHALHYHLILWLPHGFILNHQELERWWPWGRTWTKSCSTVSAWVKYISKYKDKAGLPLAARLFGCGGLDAAGETSVRKAMMPLWLRRLVPRNVVLRRMAGGGWVDPQSGEVFLPPWSWTPHGWQLKA
ncbi:rolling circle replication-associated protein [Delftia tsuruhatensis]|uniref:rolling circle replication-associated protein n=1 Tax=Delftia tsuruhatensis TaxID=180282 RepID=UPI0030D4B4D3